MGFGAKSFGASGIRASDVRGAGGAKEKLPAKEARLWARLRLSKPLRMLSPRLHNSRELANMAVRTKKKSTKRFEKKHLKEVLERRKEFAKVKQRHQLKAKKKARREQDEAKKADHDDKSMEAAEQGAPPKEKNAFQDMTMDEFFQGGFEVPEPVKQSKKTPKATTQSQSKARKRKRQENIDLEADRGTDSGDSFEGNPVQSESEEGSGSGSSVGGHKEDLNALAQKDPEFYKYLKENDAELLDFDDNENIAEADQTSGSDEAPKKKRKTSPTEPLEERIGGSGSVVTMAMANRWEDAMSQQFSLRTMREVVLAFRAAAHLNEEERVFKYSIPSPEVYHKLLVISLKHIPAVLEHHLPIKENANGRVRVPTDSKKYQSLSPLLNSHAASIAHLLENLTDTPTLKLTLASILPLLPYLLSFKKAVRNLVRLIVGIWSEASSAEATRINAFLLLRRLMIIGDATIREAVLKTAYQGLVKGSRTTTIHTLAGINLMKNSATELWGIDASLGYTTGFTYIRQLGIHLRTSIDKPTKDSHKVIYNWQYVHSLDFWSRVLSAHCAAASAPTSKAPTAPPSSPLHPLIYPLVQITLGALRLIPTPTYFPLRFHLARALLRLGRATHTYIPLVPSLLEVLQSPELRKPPAKASTLEPLDFAVAIRAPAAYARTRVYQDELGAQVVALLAEFFGTWARNVAFPELALPPMVALKRWLKDVGGAGGGAGKGGPKRGRGGAKDGTAGNRNGKVNAAVAVLVQKLQANSAFVEERRRKLEFAVRDREAVEGFLKDVAWEDMPLGAYVAGLRQREEERERVLEEGRRAQREQEERHGKEGRETGAKKKGGKGDKKARRARNIEIEEEEMGGESSDGGVEIEDELDEDVELSGDDEVMSEDD